MCIRDSFKQLVGDAAQVDAVRPLAHHLAHGERSAPNLCDLAPARVLVRQRGAYSRISENRRSLLARASLLGSVARAMEESTMPRQKDLKRHVRARMQKTGESYTLSLIHISEPTRLLS